jgi:hypothetical protein
VCSILYIFCDGSVFDNSPVKVLRLSIEEGAEYGDSSVVDNSPVKVLRLSIQEGAEYGDG